MPFTPEEIENAQQVRTPEEEAERDLVRALIDSVKHWQECEHRICRRMQRCVETQTCQIKYAEVILWWKRTYLVPYLRKRYPTVQWGVPRANAEQQIRAALEAEADREARRQARKEGKPLPPKRKRKRVPRQPLYVPPDFAGEAGRGES
jgi:hypothetical protein